MSPEELEAVRTRSEVALALASSGGYHYPPTHAIMDRAELLAEIDRLRAVLASLTSKLRNLADEAHEERLGPE